MSISSAEEYLLELLNPSDEQGKRKTALLQATFDVIAELGFEGLRTRAVADRAGVNVATLHYYFPGKQALIEGVAQFLGAKFVALHGPPPEPSGFAALDRLRQEFSDGRYYFDHEPDLLMVLQEFTMRGRRDPEVQKVVEMMYGHWRDNLEKMVRAGLAEGTFRSELDPEETLAMLHCVFLGASTRQENDFGDVQRAVERWLLTEAIWQATRGAEQ